MHYVHYQIKFDRSLHSRLSRHRDAPRCRNPSRAVPSRAIRALRSTSRPDQHGGSFDQPPGTAQQAVGATISRIYDPRASRCTDIYVSCCGNILWFEKCNTSEYAAGGHRPTRSDAAKQTRKIVSSIFFFWFSLETRGSTTSSQIIYSIHCRINLKIFQQNQKLHRSCASQASVKTQNKNVNKMDVDLTGSSGRSAPGTNEITIHHAGFSIEPPPSLSSFIIDPDRIVDFYRYTSYRVEK
ncbi:unnamed protein product [Nesidiocoris tenuis]|uniref:Uncharacterized protein n=1 Tax=Nesidiocoris tenuis TaxID=355587 RepID=A0A6H5GJH8_9HEMI|nr:unnamed protein product [Nesidiocoris tenuis]